MLKWHAKIPSESPCVLHFRLQWCLFSIKHGGYCIIFVDVTMVGLVQHHLLTMEGYMKDTLNLRTYELKAQYITAVRDRSDPKR